jgi:sporulation protein YlmC with PRC-barrel domain
MKRLCAALISCGLSTSAVLAPGIVLGQTAQATSAAALPSPRPTATTPPPTAGAIPLGVTVIEMEAVVVGWSAKKDLLGKPVVNDRKEKLGNIEDIVLAPNGSASYAIIGVGGFLGIGTRLVAIPMKQIKLENGQLVLSGATKDVLKGMPPFVYAH